MSGITQEEAWEAERLFKWCNDLQKSEAFVGVVLPAIQSAKEAAEACGTDVNRSPAERAEHHRAFHLAKELLNLVETKRESAMETLRLWKEQNGDEFTALPDEKHV